VTGADKHRLPYRPCVGAVLFDRRGRVLVGQRVGSGGADQGWQLPQGGIDEGETPRQAVIRELAEEIGTDKAEIIGETGESLRYDLPDELIGSRWDGRYRGQEVRWFALRFTGEDDDVDLTTYKTPEFMAWKWVDLEQLPGLAVPFKRAVYERVVARFRSLAERLRSAPQ